VSDVTDRPAPEADQDSAPYWAAAARNELTIQRCRSCARYQFYPRLLCTACGFPDPEWVRASGSGTVHSYTVNHRPAGTWATARVPYVVALIDLAEGPRLMANVDAEPSEMWVGMPVTVWFEEVAPGVSLPQFRPASDPDTHDQKEY
jgi:uncharacterized OB-fold protein